MSISRLKKTYSKDEVLKKETRGLDKQLAHNCVAWQTAIRLKHVNIESAFQNHDDDGQVYNVQLSMLCVCIVNRKQMFK